ncbi:response regulator [Pseudomonas schmalbachii]|uniref:Response regulator n=1 Tax=Pseudomonas schmalbachii TaxID=2816993 RepID=A0ABS3TM70_9PSED|nr:response regulator [Pseudomonas schmalbachii]MBO3274742.1 response regulator [Pseudomonas schmalbachii]
MKRFRVALADDHPLILVAVKGLIEEDSKYQVVGEARSSGELVELLRRERVDVVVTDFNMPGDMVYGDGIKFIDYLVRNFPDIRILVLTMISNRAILDALYRLGVGGVICKSATSRQLLAALNAMVHGRGRIFPAPAAGGSKWGTRGRLAELSVKEHEVVRLFVSGMRGHEIARLLNRSDKTISAQKAAAKRRLGVGSDQELLSYLREWHFLD